MFCENCGAEKYSEDAIFCTKCGIQFSKRIIEDLRDDFQINFDIAIITGLGAGVITGLFSATITQTFNYSPLTWFLLYIGCGIFILYLLITRFKSFARTLKRRLKNLK